MAGTPIASEVQEPAVVGCEWPRLVETAVLSTVGTKELCLLQQGILVNALSSAGVGFGQDGKMVATGGLTCLDDVTFAITPLEQEVWKRLMNPTL